MKKLVPVLRIHWVADRFSFLIFWGVLLVLFTISIIPIYYAESPVSIRANGSSAVIIYALVVGIVTSVESLSFALGLGVRRSDFLRGTYLFFLLHSIIQLCFLAIFSGVERLISNQMGVEISYFNIIDLVSSISVGLFLLLAFLIILHQYLFGCMLTSIYHRFGRLGLSLLGIGAFIFVLLMSLFGGWNALVPFFEMFDSFHQFAIIFLPVLILVYALVTYGCLRKVTIRA